MDGIDDIEWASLSHAYGSATDVPELLEALASGDEADWNNAVYGLYSSLCHQGTVYDATVAATPFLVDLALNSNTRDRTQLIVYLGALVDDFGAEPPDVDDLDLPSTIDRDELAEQLHGQHRRVDEIARIIASRTEEFRLLWNGEDFDLAVASAALLTFLGDDEAAEKLDELEARRPVRYAIVLPSDSEFAVETAGKVGRPELADAPFLFFAGDTSALDEIIVEDPDDFPPDLMADAGAIAAELYSEAIVPADPNLGSFRFYAGMSVDELSQICAEQGWEEVDAPIMAIEPIEEEPQDGGRAWDDISPRDRALLERFVATLAEAGWQETRPWHENLKTCGWNVSPQGVGRYFGSDAMLEVACWLYDPLLSSELGKQLGDPHVRLVIGNQEHVALPFRFYGNMGPILDVLVQHQRTVTPANYAEEFLHDMFGVCDLVLAEADGGLLRLNAKE